jgi:hypothetical protein
MWNKDWGVMPVTVSSKPKLFPESLTWPPALNAIRSPLPNPHKKKRSDNFKKRDKKFLGDEYMENPIMSSFLIVGMWY